VSEYYKIKYTTGGDTNRIRSVIVSCINEEVAIASFKMAFGGHSPSIVSIAWIARPGSMTASCTSASSEDSGLRENELERGFLAHQVNSYAGFAW